MKHTQEKSTQKKSVQNKNVQQKNVQKKLSVRPVMVCLFILAGIVSGGFIAANAQPFVETLRQLAETKEPASEPEENSVGVTEVPDAEEQPEEPLQEQSGEDTQEQVQEQPQGEPVRTVQMGEEIWYTLYDDGSLWVTGTGYTWSFSDAGHVTEYLMEQFGVKRMAVKKEWFHAVQRIVIDSRVTAIENCALSMYTQVREVVYHGTMEFIDENAFKNCGTGTEEEVLWDMDITGTKILPGAFNGCLNPPVEQEEIFIPE